jgi:uncharacterized membrane protein
VSVPSSKPEAVSAGNGVLLARRLAAIDMLRGLAVVLMVLDHARFYFDNSAALPTDIGEARPTLFFAHWLLQFCAPIFVMLTGTGAYLRLASGRSKPAVAKFLATRGLMLVAIDVFIVPLVKWFDFDLQHLRTGPLWAIGWSMVGLSALVFLRTGIVAIAGMGIVLLHNALDGIHPDSLGPLAGLWVVLHQTGGVRMGSWLSLAIAWPVLPWLGVMACGFGLGELYRLPAQLRRAMLAGSGLNLLVMFLVLRTLNLYGDPAPWSPQPTTAQTVMSYVNCTRQPPSLCYLLMTLGPALLLLAWLEGRRSARLEILAALGCVPLYCYLAHWLLLHALAVGIAVLRGQSTSWLFHMPDAPGGRGSLWKPAFGVELTLALLLGAAALAVLYFSARRYALIKFLRQPRWASYF